MFRKMAERLVSMSVILVALVMSAGVHASVDEQSRPSDRIATIVGKVIFERRQTLTPLSLCVGEGCAKAQVYWSLVVYSEDSKYELNMPFAQGSAEAPESVEVGDVIVRQGTRLAIEARVQVVTAEYAILSDVRSVNVVMDHLAVPFYGWRCHSVRHDRGVYVHISRASRDEENYSMRILSDGISEDRMPQTVATFEPVKLSMKDEALIFDGNNQRAAAKLEIDQKSESLYRFDSRLLVSSMLTSVGQRVPVETVVDLQCELTR